MGSPITYSGEWEGKPYQDKGTVIAIEEGKLIKANYWSVSFGEDKPENYVDVTYELDRDDEKTTLTITQQAKDETGKTQSEGNWNYVLEGLKKLLETPDGEASA